jgi:hypothetical protein
MTLLFAVDLKHGTLVDVIYSLGLCCSWFTVRKSLYVDIFAFPGHMPICEDI